MNPNTTIIPVGAKKDSDYCKHTNFLTWLTISQFAEPLASQKGGMTGSVTS